MEGIFMYIRPEQIAEQYEMEVKSISKGRDCFLCETDLGMRALKEYRGSEERAQFLAGMLDFLKEQNIMAEQIFFTKEGEIFARDEEEQNYLLLSAFRGAECDTKSREDMVYAVRSLAGLHNASEQYPNEVPEFVKMNPNALLLLYEKHNRELRQVRNYIRGRKQKNEFEEMFMRQFAGFFEKAQAVTEQLQNMEIREELTGFCHGDYNQHNVIFSREGVAIVNFLNFSYQIRVSDLSNFVRKMMEKNNWNTSLGMELIGAYDSVRKLKPQEFSYLYFYLAYPEKFWKIANHYSQSHKAWLSGRNTEKLSKVVAQEGAREHFLQTLAGKVGNRI